MAGNTEASLRPLGLLHGAVHFIVFLFRLVVSRLPACGPVVEEERTQAQDPDHLFNVISKCYRLFFLTLY